MSLDLDFGKAFAANRVGALLLEAIAGRLNLFVRSNAGRPGGGVSDEQ